MNGDTLMAMAETHDVSYQELVDANPQLGPNFDLIFPGDEVCKPAEIAEYVEEECVKAKENAVVEIDEVYDENDEVVDVSPEDQYITASASALVASAAMIVLGAVAMC